MNAAIAEISENVSADDYAAALRNAERAVQTFGPSCALSIEVALVKLAAAAFGNDLRPDDFELSMRTLVTADVEMDWSAYSLAREWPYQVLARVRLARGDAASAVVSSELALAYLRARRARGDTITPAIEEQLRKLAEAARAALRDRSSDR